MARVLEVVRSLPLYDVEVTGRTLEGQALQWDTPYRVTDNGRKWYMEGFRRGAFADAVRARGNWFELRREHMDYRGGRELHGGRRGTDVPGDDGLRGRWR